MTDEVIEALKLPHQVNYIHLPVQSGNNDILKKMNRSYTAKDYLEVIKKIKKARPGIAIGTDIIVGFPSETVEQFNDTIKLYKEVEFDISYTAIYSSRSGTAAAKAYRDDVPRDEKKRRWYELGELMEKITFEKNQKYKDGEVSVLVEGYKEGRCYGRSNEMKLCEFGTPGDLTGRRISVIIESPQTWILLGKICKKDE